MNIIQTAPIERSHTEGCTTWIQVTLDNIDTLEVSYTVLDSSGKIKLDSFEGVLDINWLSEEVTDKLLDICYRYEEKLRNAAFN